MKEKRNEIINALITLDYKYMARDKSGYLYAFSRKPYKRYDFYWDTELTPLKINTKYSDLFNDVKWENNEPKTLKEMLKVICLSEEERMELEYLHKRGYKWIVKVYGDVVYAFETLPEKRKYNTNSYWESDLDTDIRCLYKYKALTNKNEPFKILEILKDSGVE